ETVNIMETEDLGAIKAKIAELTARDPGAFEGDAMVVEVKEAGGAGVELAAASANPQFLEIERRLDQIEKNIEFADAEIAQRVGRKVGRDIGILYGLVAGIMVYIMIIILLSKFAVLV
ncbi:MAG: tetrahydromethanopterin S-methyltransferase subunit G, partial [Methanospirillum sp.]|nr:tetrahydromethanopterin S-methyltransferase subunit G [Methanospirillum sp.]